MKTSRIILVLLLNFSFFCKSQQYLFNDCHWMNEGWQLISYPPLNEAYSYSYFFMNGDSLHSGITYKKLYGAWKNCGAAQINPYYPMPCPNVSANTNFVGLLRETNQIWYIISKDSLAERILYRFDLNVGDTLHLSNDYLTVSSIVANYIPGRKLFNLSPSPNSFYTSNSLIEGVGPISGFLTDLLQPPPFESTYALKCATADNLIVQYGTWSGSSQMGYPAFHCDPWPGLILGIASVKPDEKGYFYPNPTSQLLLFRNAAYNSVNQFLIYNDMGALVLTKKNVNEIDGIDVGGLKNGIYFAEIDYGTYKEKVKFVKE